MAGKDKTPKSVNHRKGGVSLRAALFITAAALAILIVYSPARKMTFYYDDRVTILQNTRIQSPSWKDAFWENPFRALPNLTFALQVRLHSRSPALPPNTYDLSAALQYISEKFSDEHSRKVGFYTDPETRESIPVSVDPRRMLFFPLPPAPPFHLVNLLIHMLNAALLLIILRRLAPDYPAATAATALAFLVHPLATEPVNYATSRFTLMSTMFSLLAVAAHLRYRDRQAGKVLAGTFFIFALFSKESAAVLPLLVFLLEAARGRIRLWVLWGLLLSAVYAYLRINHWWVVPQGPGGEILPWHQYLLIEQGVLWSYAVKILFPLHLNFDPHVIPSMAANVFFAALNFTLLLASAGIVMRLAWNQVKEEKSQKTSRVLQKDRRPAKSSKEKKDKVPQREALRGSRLLRPAAVCLMAWISIAPTSSIIPLSDLAKEDRAYIMLIIVLPALVLGMAGLLRTRGTRKKDRKECGAHPYPRRVPVTCLVVIVLCLGLLCFSRNTDWKNESALTRDMLVKSPAKPRARYQYATALKWVGRYEESLFWYERVVSIDPENRDALVNIDALKRELEKGLEGPD